MNLSVGIVGLPNVGPEQSYRTVRDSTLYTFCVLLHFTNI